MKLRELVKQTGVPRETIQFYLREGVLPKPRKRGRGQAEYGDHYLELIDFIKDLQENHFLPLAVIKKVLKRLKKISPSEEHFFRMQSEFFSPVKYILTQGEVKGETSFLDLTGLGRKWLAAAEEWGVITPEVCDGKKTFSSEDVAIGKVMVEMDRAGAGALAPSPDGTAVSGALSPQPAASASTPRALSAAASRCAPPTRARKR